MFITLIKIDDVSRKKLEKKQVSDRAYVDLKVTWSRLFCQVSDRAYFDLKVTKRRTLSSCYLVK